LPSVTSTSVTAQSDYDRHADYVVVAFVAGG